jgi:hypothetical protein
LDDIPCHVNDGSGNYQANQCDELVFNFWADQSAYEHMHRVAGYEKGSDRDYCVNKYLAYHAPHSLFLFNLCTFYFNDNPALLQDNRFDFTRAHQGKIM